MRNVWVTSDTHLNHRKMTEAVPGQEPYRPFDTVDQMNEAIIENWNSCVKPGDSIMHAGDVLFQPSISEPLLAKLQGKKHLCLGNHDIITSRSYLQNYFFDINLWFTNTKERFTVAHMPLAVSLLRGKSIVQVHGHNHKGREANPRYMNVCVENWGYKPVHLDEVLKRVRILTEIEEGQGSTPWHWPDDELHPIIGVNEKHPTQFGF
jgi:calcineurin-like phosphoesterase family protein